ncbi:hypothetical protein SLEP1_g45024 [Rubroshorea leprosula]|uniref:glutathione transferase n=1 Tax=Rubroshorea leprosula TaxID=152421 RepID=A0AAV5LJD1_9ROSI|nr:hypothetical protein SLEP1_g45024 [Rubroshorea leprosula]
MGEEVVLLDFWASPFGMRVRIALEGKGVKYEYKEEQLALMQKSPLLLQSNPVYKKIPVLIHNNKPICESLIILEYIDSVWNDKFPLLPSDPYQQAQARFWAGFSAKLYEFGKEIWMKKGGEQEKGKTELIEGLKLFEKELGEKPFFGGEAMGLVDVTLVPNFTWFYVYERCGNFSIEEECPKLMQWAKRCMEIDFVAKSLADRHKVYELVTKSKKNLGLE